MNKIDKRTVNGNNNTKRGEDLKKRKRPTGYYVLRPEVKAGLKARLETVLEFYGSPSALAKASRVSLQCVHEWIKRGMISANGAYALHRWYKRRAEGFRASFCRPDLRFDGNGKPLTKRCDKRKMLMVVRESDLALKPEQRRWSTIKRELAQKDKD